MSLRHVCPVCDTAFADDKLHDAIVRAERAEAELRESQEIVQYLSLFEGGDARLAVKAERDALRALLAEARGFIYDGIMDYGDLPDRIDVALREEKK